MKYYRIVFPGEFGQHVEETWSEQQILKSFYRKWAYMVIKNIGPKSELTTKECIEDWCSDHLAVEVPKPDWITDDEIEKDKK